MTEPMSFHTTQNPITSTTHTHTLSAAGGGIMTTQVRRLTPTECERLMSYPDGHTALRADGNTVADSIRYRQCSNGVVSNVAEWLGRNILATLNPQPEGQT